MLKWKVFLFAILFSSSINCFGQSSQDPHKISLEPVDDLAVDFSFSRVLDLRPDKTNLGFTRMGVVGTEVPVELGISIGDEFIKALSILCTGKSAEYTFVLGVKDLVISERKLFYSGKERGHCYMELVILKKIDDQFYNIGEFRQHYDGYVNRDATKSHPKNILNALEKCLLSFHESNWKKEKGVLFKVDDFDRTKCNLPDELSPGIYNNFEALANSIPDGEILFDTVQYQVHNAERISIKKEKKKSEPRIKFCFSDGVSIFLSANVYEGGEHFVRSQNFGRYIYFEDYFGGSRKTMLAFGTLGYLVSSGIRPIILDAKTGAVHLLEEKMISRLFSDTPDLLEKYKAAFNWREVLPGLIDELNARQ